MSTSKCRLLAIVAAAAVATADRSSATQFGITGLFATGSNAIEVSPILGSMRGGIAASNMNVFDTGQTATGRFALADLSGGAGVGVRHDSLVSDLATGQVYVLANGTTEIVDGGTATALLAIDGNSGLLTGSSITLSQPILLPAEWCSVFSGWGRLILHDAQHDAAYDVALPSGTVTVLPPTQYPYFSEHAFCHSWAFWGVAEEIGSDLWVSYVENFTTIVRRRLPDGLRRVVGTFSNLGGPQTMCSFTMSPSNHRWYFHAPGNSQFRSEPPANEHESTGYANATWSNSFPDADGDGVPDLLDNCPAAGNHGQEDADNDGFGDVCDACVGPGSSDPDGDGACSGDDNCPSIANPGQEDSDGDGVGDACDMCAGLGITDADLDTVCDGFDNCPSIANPGQEDANTDGIGDACSPQVTINSLTSDASNLHADVTASSPTGLPLAGTVAICDGVDVTDVTFTWLGENFPGSPNDLGLTINGTQVVVVSPGAGGVDFCTEFPGSYTVPLATALSLLTPGVNHLGVNKPDAFPLDVGFLSWTYATITTSSGSYRVKIFDAFGGDDYDNPNLCESGFVESVTTEAATPPLCNAVASQSWSGQLPCGVDISGLRDQSFTLQVTATDGAVVWPSSDSQSFTHAGEANVFVNNSDCCDANPCTVDVYDMGSGDCSFVPGNAGTVCRAAIGICDAAETCDGVSSACPSDVGQPASAGTVCRAAAGACDVAETCDGVSGACPTDAAQPDGTSCSDGQFCNGAEQCLAGACQPGSAPCPFVCDESNDQCVSNCPSAPQSGCKNAGTSILLVKNDSDDSKDMLLWKWLKGPPTMLAEFGDPQNTADYALCLYGSPFQILLTGGQLRVPRSSSKWTPQGGRGWKYDDATASAEGARKVRLTSSSNDKSRATLKGTGTALPDLVLPVSPSNLPLLVQLLNSQTATCFESTFGNGDVLRSDDARFKAKTP